MCTCSQVGAVLTATLLGVVIGIEIVERSPDVLVPQSSPVEVSCTGDASWSMCSWEWRTNRDVTTSCDVASSAKGSESVCALNDRVAITGSEDTCSVRVDVMEIDDGGAFICKLIELGEGSDITIDTKQINVEIAVPAEIAFAGDILDVETDKWMVEEGSKYTVECHGTAGYPAAEIRAYLGEGEEISEEDNSLEAENVEPVENEDDARLLDIKKVFRFTPSRSDCGKFVKCEGKQWSKAGDLLFEGSVVRHKQIMVVFSPRELRNEDVCEFGYSEEHGSGQMEVAIQFESHPIPKNEQVVWHLGEAVLSPGEVYSVDVEENGDEDEEASESGNDEGSISGEKQDAAVEPVMKYEAKEVEKDEEGDTVTVRLIIHNVQQHDSQLENFITVANDVRNSQVLQIPFTVLFEAAPLIETTVTEADLEELTEALPEVLEDQLVEQEEISDSPVDEPVVKSSGAGGGTVAAIVLILIALGISATAVLWLKKKERLCFKPYQEVNQKPDSEAAREKPIVKDQEGKNQNGQNDEKV